MAQNDRANGSYESEYTPGFCSFYQNKLTPGDDTLSQPEKIPDKSAEKERPSVIGRLKAAQEKLAEKTERRGRQTNLISRLTKKMPPDYIDLSGDIFVKFTIDT